MLMTLPSCVHLDLDLDLDIYSAMSTDITLSGATCNGEHVISVLYVQCYVQVVVLCFNSCSWMT